ncbi:hypothetical protein C8J56DRAFT_1174079 [Mycena floridula]|nr:hypothetical protein C8J56DRAFT_1174079 [Mycena floridula]
MVSLFESAAPKPQVETSLSPAYDQLPVAILLDSLVQSFLFGLVLGQAVKYWTRFGDDPWHKKGYVIVIVLLSMQHPDFSSGSQGLESGDTAPRMGAASFWVWLNLPTTGSVSLLCEGQVEEFKAWFEGKSMVIQQEETQKDSKTLYVSFE